MKYVIEGSKPEIDKVLRENRVRVAMGLIKFSPLADAPVKKPAADTKEVPACDDKHTEPKDTKEAPRKPRKSKK